MTNANSFLFGVLGVALLALVVMLFLRRALYALLIDLCGSEKRAQFWIVFWTLGVVLVSTFAVLAVMPGRAEALWSGSEGLFTMLSTVRAGLLALLLVLSALGLVLLIGISGYETRRARLAAWNDRATLPRA